MLFLHERTIFVSSFFFFRYKCNFIQCDSWKHTVVWHQEYPSQSVRIHECLVELIKKSFVSTLTQNLTLIPQSTYFCRSSARELYVHFDATYLLRCSVQHFSNHVINTSWETLSMETHGINSFEIFIKKICIFFLHRQSQKILWEFHKIARSSRVRLLNTGILLAVGRGAYTRSTVLKPISSLRSAIFSVERPFT